MNADWRTMIPPDYRSLRAAGFGYSLDFTPLTASVSLPGQLTIQDDAHFVILAGVAVVTTDTNATRLGFVPQLVQIQDTGSGTSFFSSPTHFHNVFGTAEQPALWQQPRVVERGSTMTITLQNLEAVNRNVRLLFVGAKLYNR